MSFATLAERGLVPDWLIRMGIRRLCSQRLRLENRTFPGDRNPTIAELADQWSREPIAVFTDKANQQHYEVPTDFFLHVLGPRLKYSCGLFDWPETTLVEAEEAMLTLTCQRAEIVDGMDLLDLGCGWGSLSLWLAEKYPSSKIQAVSNSRTQREFIQCRAAERGLTNIEVQTADMRDFATNRKFDRVVSVEMFEHLRNHEEILRRIRGWLQPTGKLFVHIFTHQRLAYTFGIEGESNWLGRHFFTGGMMPSEDLLNYYPDDLIIEKQWRVSGQHYRRTSDAWLANLDAQRATILQLFAAQPGADSPAIKLQRWRMFFPACSELFGYAQGEEWGVTHYLLVPA